MMNALHRLGSYSNFKAQKNTKEPLTRLIFILVQIRVKPILVSSSLSSLI